MLEPTTLAAFVAAAVALILTPGPDTVYVLTRGLGARVAGVFAALGISVGVLLHTLAAALGLSALLRASPAAFSLVRYAGAAYLVYLGIQAFRGEELTVEADETEGSFRGGVLVNALNPKVALFFLAFLPQFTGTGPDAPLELVVLGGIYAGLTAVYLGIVAVMSNRVSDLLTAPRVVRGLGVVAGVVFVGFGVALALG